MYNRNKYDVAIIGGSYAGLSAAMALGRALRHVIIFDGGMPCNIQTPHSHNFLTQDGKTPAEISTLAVEQVLSYPTVSLIKDQVTQLEGVDGDFTVETSTGRRFNVSKVIFTTGIRDIIPSIPGFKACWGISVIHCPYCHGYEYRDQETGILANGNMAFEMANLIANWTKKLTIFTNGVPTLTQDQYQRLKSSEINVVEEKISAIVHQDGQIDQLCFEGREPILLDALYARLPFEQHSHLPKEMGCEFDEKGYLKVDDFKKTSVAGISAAGDNTSMARSVAMAVAAGNMAGAFINHDLISENLQREQIKH
jgi:thioredoxin reductase